MKIVIVEDEPTDSKLACVVLAADGHDVFDARDAAEALETIRREKPKFVLVDLNLPGMDGLTLVRTLKANPATRHIRVVAITAYASRFTRKDALDAGCDAYLEKPMDTRGLSNMLQQADSKSKRASKATTSPRKPSGGL
ncbi:MAG: response regulator [candidate division NC10 bacterium]|nr:response regulator [candidate division NC10 bacterium]